MNNKPIYTFSKAYHMFLSQGTPIKRIGWLGYWVIEDKDLVMYCMNGDVVHLGKGCDPLLTLFNIAQDDWMPVYDDLRKDLDVIRERRLFG